MANVQLAIRVRPFTERELKSDIDRVPVVGVVDSETVTITNIKVSASGAGDSRERVRTYHADYIFDSSCPTSEDYASQEKVFETLGRVVLSTVVGGRSGCVLAYGQSATGKTHTMMGTEESPGLVPRLCRALAEDHTPVTVSFLEIYNERVHDLLCTESDRVRLHSLPRRRGNARKDLRVREHPQRGPYVQNLRRVAVHDAASLLSLVAEGGRRRRTAATRRNPASSRSHAVLELAVAGATLHLADLAGSEKASWEGCGGGRQKEGANINKSLVALSNVISALVAGGSRGRFVPYRDSALTWLLKDCFTGGASTFVIATVSPSASCYGESASTLRWSARARQLPQPRACVTAPLANRAALQAQYDRLLAELTRNHIRYMPESGKITYDEIHWTLQSNKVIQLCSTSNNTSKIGNLTSMFNPKTEMQNSESTASSVTSGSSDVINVIDKNIKDEISKEVDNVFGPALERTRSGSDIEVTAPLRHKRRQYKSQEVLPVSENLLQVQTLNDLPIQRQEKFEGDNIDKIKPPSVPILYDNQRAEIVASVTERLYSKLKKKEETVASKLESVVDRKIMEPLSELRICTNARQRLMELSQRALRNKRRIGIPAHTQTKRTVTRVRDQAIGVQTDLESYWVSKENTFKVQRDVSTETIPLTPRCKEISVGSNYGYLDFSNKSTITEYKPIVRKNSYVMTDIVKCFNSSTQTPIQPPPRRKKRQSTSKKCLNCDSHDDNRIDSVLSPIIRINISQQCPINSESQSSDDNLDNNIFKHKQVDTTPDLLTNHSTIETSVHEEKEKETEGSKIDANHCTNIENSDSEETGVIDLVSDDIHAKTEEEFPDSEDRSLPRVTGNSSPVVNQLAIKNMILGRNRDMYPYNIVLSPPKVRDTKCLVSFEGDNLSPSGIDDSKTEWEWQDNEDNVNNSTNWETDFKEPQSPQFHNKSTSDSTDSSKVNTHSWKLEDRLTQYNKPMCSLRRDNMPIYKGGSKYRQAKSRIYREFLGLENVDDSDDSRQCSSLTNPRDSSSDSLENERARHKFRQRKQFFEDKFNPSITGRFDFCEKKLLDSCKKLDTSVCKYETYIARDKNNKDFHTQPRRRTPTEYLNHLVRIRKEIVRGDCETTDS